MEALGLALATALGLWVYLGVQAAYFLSGRSALRLGGKRPAWGEAKDLVFIGLPGGLSYGYQTIRGLIVNGLLGAYIGVAGLSAFAAANNLLAIFWAIPVGMLAVSRMMIGVSTGEEDRQTLTDIMRVMFFRYIPLMCAVCALIIVSAVPLTQLFYQDPAEPVYMMMVWGLRILPLCMPLSLICMHFVCYGQASGKTGLVHVLSLLDGAVCVCVFTALLIPLIGMNSVYIANVLNGIVCALVIFLYAWGKQKHLPRNMEELMVIPDSFGVSEDDRMDRTLRSTEEVVTLSEQVQQFCLKKGIDSRRAYLSGLFMEEMAANIVEHGFTKDSKKHSIDVRVVHKDGSLILRLRDDCRPFDPGSRNELTENEDPTKNIGIRMVFGMAEEVQYQNILGMNVLTIRI